MHTSGGKRELSTQDKSQSHAKPGKGRMGMSSYPLTTPCLAATSMNTANNRHLLNTNCVHLPGTRNLRACTHRLQCTTVPSPTGAQAMRLRLVSLFCPNLPLVSLIHSFPLEHRPTNFFYKSPNSKYFSSPAMWFPL